MTTWTVEIVVPESSNMKQAGETVTIDVDEDEYLLSAARAAGVWLPADCQQGWCTTCASKLVEGEVDRSSARRYYEEDDDYVLICTAKPRSDVRIEVCKMQELLELRAEHGLPPGSAKLDTN